MNWQQTNLGYRNACQGHLMVLMISNNILERDHNVQESWLHDRLTDFFTVHESKAIKKEP
jgi:hypothetical protein